MRILVVQESDYLERGPHQSHHLLERLVQRGHEVHLIDYQVDWKKHRESGIITQTLVKEDAFKVMAPGVTVFRPPIVRLPVLSYASLLVTHRQEIAHQIDEFHPDIVIGFGLLNARLAIHQCSLHGVPFIYYTIDELHRLVPEALFRPIARYVESNNYQLATKVLSINQGLREYTEEMGADSSKTAIIRAGVDYERFSSADGSDIRQKYGFKDTDTVLFFMGWVYPFSGLDTVAEQLASLGRKNIKMLILGKGELWEELQSIRKANGLEDQIALEGWKPYDQVPSYIAASDICLLPAQKNQIMQNIVPIKMYEYMAAGKPVIATDLSGIRKEFGDDNGVVYVQEPHDTLMKVLELVSMGQVRELGRKAQDCVKGNDWTLITDAFEDLLVETVEQNGQVG